MQTFNLIFATLVFCSLLVAGDMVAFDNRRVMHARESYDARQERELEGFYGDWDSIRSGIRLARIKRAQKSAA